MATADELESVLNSPELLEELASVEHDRWSHWQRYVHAQCQETSEGGLLIPPALVERWTGQLNTPYSALSEEEKESDREQVRRYLPVITSALRRTM